MEAVIAACARSGACLEINAHPARMDLDWRWHQKALRAGATFSINPDAHSTAELELIGYGIDAARKGGLEAAAILNALDLETLRARLSVRKGKALR